MNIEKLAKHLKEFTLDEIEMIAEVDCKMGINQLINEHKIEFKNEKYYYLEKENFDFDIFYTTEKFNNDLTFKNAIKNFMINYAEKHCSNGTIIKYRAIFKFDILPFFKSKKLNNIEVSDIRNFYEKCKELKFKPLRIKNTLALLNQLIKYYQNLGVIERKCVFQVKRLTNKNKFSINRIIF